MTRRRAPGIAAVLLVTLSACSDAARSDSAIDDAGGLPGALTGRFEPLATIGRGRATHGASTDGRGALVATTIGAGLVDADGEVTPLEIALTQPPTQVVVSADGQHGVIIDPEQAELWSLRESPQRRAGFSGVRSAEFNGDGSRLVVTTPNELLSVSTQTPDEPTTLAVAPAGSQFGAAAISSDGLVVAPLFGGGADLLIYTDATGAAVVDVFAEPTDTVDRVELTEDGSRVVMTTTTADPFAGRLASWSTADRALVWETDLGDAGLSTMWALGTDGRTLLSDDEVVRLVDADGSVVVERAHGGPAPISVVATTGGYALAHLGGTVEFLDVDGARAARSAGSGRPAVDIESLTSTDGVIVVDSAGTVTAWGTDGALIAETTSYRSGTVNDVAVSPDGSLIAFGSAAGVAGVTSIDGSMPPVELVHPEGNVDSVAFATDGSQLLTGVGARISDELVDDTSSMWDIGTTRRIATFRGGGEHVHGGASFKNTVRYAPDGEVFVVVSHDFSVSLHAADTGEVIEKLPPHAGPVLDIGLSPTGDRLVTSSEDGSVRVWDLVSGDLLHEYPAAAGGYWSLAFLPDATSFLASDVTGTIRVVDLATGTELRSLAGSTVRASRLSISPDGALVAAGGDGNTVGVWSSISGEQLARIEGHAAPVTATAFSPDGAVLVTGSGDGTVRLWSVG
jgi:WD40 repeat protein